MKSINKCNIMKMKISNNNQKCERREMNMAKLRILVACGSGICTSTVAAQITREVCDEYGIDELFYGKEYL